MKSPVELHGILDSLRALDEASTTGGVTSLFLETEISENGSELRINGNPPGLIHFARAVLEVAAKAFDGAHQHFDESEGLDHCDLPVVIRLKPAERDEA